MILTSIEKLEQHIKYRFKDTKLAKLAISHRSYSKDNNERLEFLGDSILNFVIAHALYDKFSNATEGQLSRLRAQLVRGTTLAEIAKEFELGRFLNLGVGELKSGGRNRESILADAFEALIGAIYLDSDLETCKRFIMAWFESRIRTLNLDMYQNKDSKTKLQEYLQSNHKQLPHYELASIEGKAHEQVFSVTCNIEGLSELIHGKGMSRRSAEQSAAHEALVKLNVIKGN